MERGGSRKSSKHKMQSSDPIREARGCRNFSRISISGQTEAEVVEPAGRFWLALVGSIPPMAAPGATNSRNAGPNANS